MKAKITDLSIQLHSGNVNHWFVGALIGVNSIIGCGNISDFFGKGKESSPLLQVNGGYVRAMVNIGKE